SQVYPTKFFGFGAGRATNSITGIGSGVQDLSKGPDLIPLFGFGQTARTANGLRPPPDTSTGVPVAYGNAATATNSDASWGNPCNPAGGAALPAGSARLLTGTWIGTAPTIQTLSV